MSNTLSNRLARIEASIPEQKAERRVLRVIAHQGEEAAALDRLRREGQNPDDPHTIVILRTIVSANLRPAATMLTQ